MAANQILPFAQGLGANVLDQASYLGDAQRPLGNQPGTARATFVNKALLQLSAIAAGMGQFLADKQASDVTDQLSAATFSAMWQAAVKAATGGLAGVVPVTTTATLAASAANCLIALTNGSYTLTLPAANSVKAGDVLRFRCALSSNVALARQGADTVGVCNGADALVSLVLRNGDGLTLVSDGASKWYAVDGSAAAFAAAVLGQGPFAFSVGATSWYQLPSGVIVQTGVTTVPVSSVATVTLPVTFPSSIFNVVASGYATTFNPATQPYFGGVAVSTSQIGLQSMYTASSASIAWIATGR